MSRVSRCKILSTGDAVTDADEARQEPTLARSRFPDGPKTTWETGVMRGILLWLIGIPIPIIILLYLFDVI